MRSEEDEGTGCVEGKGGAGYMGVRGMHARANAAASASASPSPSAPARQSLKEADTERREISSAILVCCRHDVDYHSP